MQEKNEHMHPGGDGIEDRLWEYIDGTLPSSERTRIGELIASQAEWKSKYQELLAVHELLHSTELSEPSMRFTKNVMDEIGRLHIAPATRTYINKRIIWGIGIFFITLIIGFIIYGIGQINWNTSGDTKLPVDINNIDYSRMFSNSFVNIFMMVNVVLGLVLLDRYLSNKRKKMHKGIDV